MLTKEERHALAVRVRLGETTTYSKSSRKRWVLFQYMDNDRVAEVYALGVLIGKVRLGAIVHVDPSNWEDGTPYEWGGPDEILAYLERD